MPSPVQPTAVEKGGTESFESQIGSIFKPLDEIARLAEKAARDAPAELNGHVRHIGRTGMNLVHVLRCGGLFDLKLSQRILVIRQQILKDLELSTAAEIMLLDAALDAYAHWAYLSALTRSSMRSGTSTTTIGLHSRLMAMAQSSLRTYMDAMRALQEVKRPPIRVLQVQAGENVAVQVNEARHSRRRQFGAG